MPQLYVGHSLVVKVRCSQGTATVALKTTFSIPSALAVKNTYLIFSQGSYKYVPTFGYVLAKAGITMSDSAYTRPRQSACVNYPDSSHGC